MPFADNLYSADDSDAESFSDELSPADGYFSNRDHLQDVMVPDPSLETGPNTAESKVREAGEEATARAESRTTSQPASPEVPASSPLRVVASASSAIYSPSSPTAYLPRSPTSSQRRQDDLYSETSPLLHSIAPPPAYSAATSQSALPHFNRNYSTISAHQLEEGIRGPESMGQPSDSNERSPLWMKQVKKSPRWRLFRNILLVALVLGLAVGFIVAAVKSGESKNNKGTSPPGKSPTSGPGGGHGSYCSSAAIHAGDSMPIYEFKSGMKLIILQVTGGNNFRGGPARVHTAGEIIMRRLPEGREDQDTGYITFDVWLSELGITYRVEMDAEAQALKVLTPEFADLTSVSEHCLSFEITVWIPPNANFETVLVESTSLSIRLLDDVDIHVSQRSQIETYSGDVHFPSRNLSSVEDSKPAGTSQGFSSREIAIGTASGDITGTFILHDQLYIETDSGNIDISVAPQPAPHDGVPNTAQLTLAAASGDISCRYPIWNAAKIPDRDYRTSVTAHSGDISGDYVIGTEAILKTISGELNIIGLPTIFTESTFKTESTSGSQHITVLEPLSRHRTPSSLPAKDIDIDIGDNDPYLIHPPDVAPIDSDASVPKLEIYRRRLTHLISSHDGSSGDMKIHYPSAWEGEITATTISGNIRVGGEGVRTIRDSRKNWAFHEVVARKGPRAEYASTLDMHGISGSLDVWVGDSCLTADWCKMDAM